MYAIRSYYALTAADGQPLIKIGGDKRVVPARPANPEALPETDPLHWWDMEFAGEITNKTNIPKSPADGAIGKKVIMIVHGDVITSYSIHYTKLYEYRYYRYHQYEPHESKENEPGPGLSKLRGIRSRRSRRNSV